MVFLVEALEVALDDAAGTRDPLATLAERQRLVVAVAKAKHEKKDRVREICHQISNRVWNYSASIILVATPQNPNGTF